MSSLREDRFFSSAPFATQEAFNNSRFLELYNKTHRHPDAEIVIDSLLNLQRDSVEYQTIIEEIMGASQRHDVIIAYTSSIKVGSQTFYNYINQQLCNDTWRTLRHLMPLIRRATYQINRHPPPNDCVAYRGMKLTYEQRSNFKIGVLFRFPGFTSTSKSKSRAGSFGNTLFEIHIYAGCLQVRDVSDISHFPNEEEYLFSPYSLFEVTDKKDGMIVLRSIDNKSKVGMHSTKSVPKDDSLAYSSPNLNWPSTVKSTQSSNKHVPHHQPVISNLPPKTTSNSSSNLNSSSKSKFIQSSNKYVPHHQSIPSNLSTKPTPSTSSNLNSSSKNKFIQSSNKYVPHHQSIPSNLSTKPTPSTSSNLNSSSKNKFIQSSNKYAPHHQSITSKLSTKPTSNSSSNSDSSSKNKFIQSSDKDALHHQSITPIFSSSVDFSSLLQDKSTKSLDKNSSNGSPVTPTSPPKKKKSLIRRIRDFFKSPDSTDSDRSNKVRRVARNRF